MINNSEDMAIRRKQIGSLFFLPVLLATLMFILINTCSQHFLETGIWVAKTIILPAILVIVVASFHFFKK